MNTRQDYQKQNSELWDRLSTTNPAYTKSVPASWGGKITTINAHYQVRKMTDEIGQVGKAWGWNATYETKDIRRGEEVIPVVFAYVTIWVGEKEKAIGPIASCMPMIKETRKDPRGKLDDEAPKKAMTDALTKGLSHFGCDADIFLGEWDNNKYVNNSNNVTNLQEEL